MMNTAQIDGQISLFDLLEKLEPKKDPECLLHKGQNIYKLYGCTVEEYTVANPYQVGQEMHYTLDRLEGGHGTTKDSEVGKCTFTNRNDMEKAVITYVRNHPSVLMPKTIESKVTSIMGFHKKNCDGKEIKSICAILDDDSVYIKDWSIYGHIIKCDSLEKALRLRREWIKKNAEEEELTDFTNVFVPMYPCTRDCDWDYAEAKYKGSMV